MGGLPSALAFIGLRGLHAGSSWPGTAGVCSPVVPGTFSVVPDAFQRGHRSVL